MIISSEIKNRILQTINVFETGSIDGEYDNISIYNDGKNNTRQVTYGRSQTTEQGNLKDLIKAYIDNKGVFSLDFEPYLPKIGVTPLHDNTDFINLLKKAAKEDNVMRDTQDTFFDKHYYQPALKFSMDNGFSLPLSMLVIYDSYIHSGGILDFLRKRFDEVPPKKGGDEKSWTKAYVKTRREWLESKGGLLAKTVYRMECFELQMSFGNWHITEPINANGTMTRSIDEPSFTIIKLTPEERAHLRGNRKYVKRMT